MNPHLPVREQAVTSQLLPFGHSIFKVGLKSAKGAAVTLWEYNGDGVTVAVVRTDGWGALANRGGMFGCVAGPARLGCSTRAVALDIAVVGMVAADAAGSGLAIAASSAPGSVARHKGQCVRNAPLSSVAGM